MPDEVPHRSVVAVARLLRDLMVDPRVPVHAKAVAGASIAGSLLPLGPGTRRGGPGRGLAGLLLVTTAWNRLIVEAGYEVVRDLWRGSDAGFAWLLMLTGMDD